MDLRKLKTLIDLVSDSNVSELEITEAEGKVRIVKSAPVGVQPMMAAAPAAVVTAPAVAVAAPVVGVLGNDADADLDALASVGDTLTDTEAIRLALGYARQVTPATSGEE